MRLTELHPVFIRLGEEARTSSRVDTLAEAQGVRFLCPKCYQANGGPIGTHSVVCWSRTRGVPDHVEPGPGRWRLEGTGLEDLSLMEEPGHTRSVLLLCGCAWHGFVTNGEVTTA